MSARAAILEATVELLLSDGYEQLTIEGIAKRAGVGKQTIYRWWRTRGELLVECVEERWAFSNVLTVPHSGNLGLDLTEWAAAASAEAGDLLRPLVTAAAAEKSVADALGARFPFMEVLTSRIQFSVEAGESDAVPETLARAIIGRIVMGALDDTVQNVGDFIRSLVALVEVPVERHPDVGRID